MNRRELFAQRRAVTIAEACALARVSRRTIYNWLRAGKLDVTRTASGAVRIDVDSLFHGPAPAIAAPEDVAGEAAGAALTRADVQQMIEREIRRWFGRVDHALDQLLTEINRTGAVHVDAPPFPGAPLIHPHERHAVVETLAAHEAARTRRRSA